MAAGFFTFYFIIGGKIMRNFWCEIDTDAVEYNIKKVREKTNKRIMAVVKANGYGLGIEDMTGVMDNLVDAFGVSNIEEALRVKSSKDILILYPAIDDNDIKKLRENFVLTVDNNEILEKLNKLEKPVRVHVYVDTGMNRFGVKPDRVDEFIKSIRDKYQNIKLEGIYSHLHNTGDYKYTINQIDIFKGIAKKYSGEIENIHLLNTNGFHKFSDVVDFDNMVRLGNLIYGYNSREYGYKKIFSYKAVPIRVYNVNEGQYIGYGNSFRAKKNMSVGILDLGFIDKFGCVLDIKKNVFYEIAKSFYHHIRYTSGITCRGKVVRILGKPNMNFTIIDMEGFKEDDVFNIALPSVIADSSIPKKYRKGDSCVSI